MPVVPALLKSLNFRDIGSLTVLQDKPTSRFQYCGLHHTPWDSLQAIKSKGRICENDIIARHRPLDKIQRISSDDLAVFQLKNTEHLLDCTHRSNIHLDGSD